MSDYEEWTRALVAASRTADDPTRADTERVGRALMARAAAAGALGATAATATKAAALGSSLALKLAASTALVGIAVIGGVWLQSPKASPPHASAPSLTVSRAPAAPLAGTVTKESHGDTSIQEAAPAANVAPAAPPQVKPKQASSLNLDAEATLLAEAQRALGAGHVSDTLSQLNEYDRRFPGGMLRLEADAVRVLALCRAGRKTEGEAATRRFLQRYPGSPQATRVEQACRGEAPTPKTKGSGESGEPLPLSKPDKIH